MNRFVPAIFVAGLLALGAPASAQVPSPTSMGIKLPNPKLKMGQSIGDTDVEGAVRVAVGGIDASVKTESIAAPGSTPVIIHEMVIANVPVGYGTLRSTSSVPDPGPKVTGNDPRVIPIEKQPLLERLIGRNNFLPVGYLASGVNAARAVARVAMKYVALPDAGLGTGFMIGPRLFMTNNHVIGSAGEAKQYDLQFNYQFSDDGSRLLPHETYEMDPASVFLTDPGLDFTIVAVKPRVKTDSNGTSQLLAGDEFGYVSLTKNYFYSEKQLANVIQHPNGQHKQIAIQENEIASIHKSVVRYTADTEPGSSGSPVFNNMWRIIALHHSAGDYDDQKKAWLNNEGIRVDAIIDAVIKANPAVAKELRLQ